MPLNTTRFCRTFTAALAVAAVALPAYAAEPNTGWQEGYTGEEPNTLLLWKFDGETSDEQLRDASPHGRNATLRGESEDRLGVEGKFGQGLRVLAGTGERTGVYLADTRALHSATGALTVELWYKSTNNGFGWIIDKKQADSMHWGFYLTRDRDNQLKFQVGNGEKSETLQTEGLTWTPNAWYHLAITFENTGDPDTGDATISLYRNGEQLGTRTLEGFGDLEPNTRPFTIGDRETGTNGGGEGRGVYDEVRVSNVAYTFTPADPS